MRGGMIKPPLLLSLSEQEGLGTSFHFGKPKSGRACQRGEGRYERKARDSGRIQEEKETRRN